MYKLNLSDNSFLIANGEDKILVYSPKLNIKRRVSVKNADTSYYLMDMQKGKLTFTKEEIDTDLKPGRYKLSQDIEIGDLVKGEYDEPVQVIHLHQGQDEMYEIEIQNKTYVVNGGHILHLIDKETGEKLEIQTEIYVYMDDEFKSHYNMEIRE